MLQIVSHHLRTYKIDFNVNESMLKIIKIQKNSEQFKKIQKKS